MCGSELCDVLVRSTKGRLILGFMVFFFLTDWVETLETKSWRFWCCHRYRPPYDLKIHSWAVLWARNKLLWCWVTREWNNIQKSAQIISLMKVNPSRPKIRRCLRVLLHHSPLPLPYKYCKQYPGFQYHKLVCLVLNLLQMESFTIQYVVLSPAPFTKYYVSYLLIACQ